jgi:hypothetical protein
MSLRPVATDLWITEQPLRFAGLEVGARMTVVRLVDGSLLLHSPIRATPELRSVVESIGRPSVIVAPNRFHHLYATEWTAAFPAAKLVVAPNLSSKRPDLAGAELLGDAPRAEWSEVLDQVFVRGFPLANEVVFFHRTTGTLIVTDLLFNIGAGSPLLTRVAFGAMGAAGKPSSTLLERVFVRDRAAFRASLERVLQWPIRRIVMAHGEIFEGDGNAAISSAYSWVLGG